MENESSNVPGAEPQAPDLQPPVSPAPESMPPMDVPPVTQAPVSQPGSMNVNLGITPGNAGNGPFPEELRGWNWGAFFFSWVWAIANNTWLGLLALIPFLGFIMSIILGVKGNELAWKNRKFEGVDHFKKVQKAWARWGIIFFLIWVLLLAALIAVGIKGMGSDDVTRKSDVAKIATDVEAFANNPIYGSLPYTLDDLGKVEPVDPLTHDQYTYVVDAGGLKGQVCATLSDNTQYCKDVTAPNPLTSPTDSTAPSSSPL